MKRISELEYKKALTRIKELFPLVDENTPKDDPNLIELDKACKIVESYELEHYPIQEMGETIENESLRFTEGFTAEKIRDLNRRTNADSLDSEDPTNTYWNYCIMAHKDPNGDISFAIHELYYENDIPYAYTENPVAASGDCPKEVIKNLRMMLKDVKDKPIIWSGIDFPKEYIS